MIYLTVDKIMTWKPCFDWPRERVASVFGKRKRLPLLNLLHMSDISEADRVWLGCHALPAPEARLLACLWATRELKRVRAVGYEPDPTSWDAVRMARRFANGRATTEERVAAARAATAVWPGSTATTLYKVAAEAAWDTAAWAMANGAAAARKQQLRDIIRIVKRLEKGGEA